MNPKKHIYEYIKKQHNDITGFQDPEEAAKWQEVFDGMSSGTARIIIERETGDSLPDGYKLGLQNKGRYYLARIIGQQGRVLHRLLVDKQTGSINFVA